MIESTRAQRVRPSLRRVAVGFALSLLVGLMATVAVQARPAAASTFMTTGVPNTFQLNDITCVSSTTCVAVGSSAAQGAAAVEIVDGVAGTVATSTDANAARLDSVYCVSATSCLASGVGQSAGEVIPITLGSQATLGTPQYVAGTFELFGLSCSTATTCVAVGGTSISGAESVGAVVDIDAGVAQPVQDVPDIDQFLGVGCVSATTCVAAGNGNYTDTDVITNGVPGAVQQDIGTELAVYTITCTSSSCVAVGFDEANDDEGAYVIVGATGTAGPVQDVTGAGPFIGVQCPNSTCVAVGSAYISGSDVGEIDAFTPGATAGSPQDDPDASSFSGVYCTTDLSCLAAGDGAGSTVNEGVVATNDLTAATATISGTVELADNGNTAALPGSPLQICATDSTYCAAGEASASDGSYSFSVPSGDTYVVTAYSPSGESYTPGLSAPTDAATAGQTYSGTDVTLTPGPGLGSGVSVTGFGAEQNSGTAVPTVNWGIPFAVTLAPSVFQTPTGDTSTLLTLVLTGVNTQTGAVVSKTVYAGGEITVNGQSAAVGLPVDPSQGVTVQVPALAPIHGAVGMAVTYSNSPNPATGVTAAPDPVVLTNGNPSASVTVAATDFGVDHTVGVPTLSGPDSASFSIGTPDCAGANLVQNSGGTSPDQSCAIPVTWHPPTTPSQNTYQATIGIPVTNSSGQAGVLQDQLFACDTRIQGNSQCSQGAPPAPPASPTAVGGANGVPIGGLYIDPSGEVETPVAGGGTAPVSGATVTLAMEDPSTSTFSAVPDGSDVMSPDNRVNPVTTGADGSFGWDTLAGTYEITAAKSGCSNTPQTTSAITVPPAATGVVITLDCAVSQTPTATSLASTPSSPITGDTVTLAATVTGSSPTGTVTFEDGTNDLGSASVNSSTGEATLQIGTLSPGPHTITASYGGDADNGTSQGQATVNIAAPAEVGTTMSVTADPGSSSAGQAVTYGASVIPASGSATPSGQVTFSVGATTLCAASLSSTGPGVPATASCSAANAPVGSDTVSATYGGDSTFSGSSGTTTESVSAAVSPPPPPAEVGTTMSVTADPGSSSAGQAVTYGASVIPASGSATPSGQVTFSVGATTLCAASLSSTGPGVPATASCSAANAPVGSDTVSATYGGDSTFSGSSGTTTESVSAPLPPLALSVKTSSLPSGAKGEPYVAILAHAGGGGTYSWGVTTGKLPTGLKLSSAGRLAGTPTKAGTYSFVVRVTDSVGQTSTRKLSVKIAEIAVRTATLEPGKDGVRYFVGLTVYGGSGGLAWSHSGSLPKGVTLSRAGTITGKPERAGTYVFVVEVRDRTGATATARLVLVIRK